MILLQTVPTHIQVDSLQRKLLQEIEGVLAVHEFHVWQLAGDRIIASAHIRCRNLHDYQQIAEKVKEFFHNEGIHSTTIQPEFVEFDTEDYEYYENEERKQQQHQLSVGSNLAVTFVDSGGKSAPFNGQPNGNANQLANGGPAARRYVGNRDNCTLDCPPGPSDCMQNTCCGPQQRRTPTQVELENIESGNAGKRSSVKRSPTEAVDAAQTTSFLASGKQQTAPKANFSSSSSSSLTASLPPESSKSNKISANDNTSQASSNDGSDTGSTSKLTKESDNV